MVLFNYSTKEITAKIVYYGPGLCGKTTNLQFIYDNLPDSINKGKMLSLATKTDRTLFFDFLPIDLGTIRGMKTRLQLYTVPGQVFYNTTRKLVLKGCDGVIFVADSQKTMLEANIESFKNLEENLAEQDMKLSETPLIVQFNKRDLPAILGIEELNAAINLHNAPIYEAVATTGIGVHETLKAATRLVLNSLRTRYADQRERTMETPTQVAAAAATANVASEVTQVEDHDKAPAEATSHTGTTDVPGDETVTMPPVTDSQVADEDLTLGPDLPPGEIEVDDSDVSSFDADRAFDTPSEEFASQVVDDLLEVVPQDELTDGNNVLELADDVAVDDDHAPAFDVDQDVDSAQSEAPVLPVAAQPDHVEDQAHHEGVDEAHAAGSDTDSFPVHELQQPHAHHGTTEINNTVNQVDGVSAHLKGQGEIHLPVSLTIGDRTAHFELTLSLDVKQPVVFSGVNGEGEEK